MIFLKFWNAVSPKKIVRFWWNFRRDSVRDKRWFRPSFKTIRLKTMELHCFVKKTIFMNNYPKNRPRMLCKKYIVMIFLDYHIWTIFNVWIQDLQRFFHIFYMKHIMLSTVEPHYSAPTYNELPLIEHTNSCPKKYFHLAIKKTSI